jgi:PASTA domain
VDDLDVLALGADESPTVPDLPPVAPEAPEPPPVLPGPPAPMRSPGSHRRDPADGRPWPMLAGLVAVAVLAAVGLAWLAGGLLGGPLPTPATRSPAASPQPSIHPSDTGSPIDTSVPTFSTTPSRSAAASPTPRPSPSARPSAATVPPPAPRLVRVPVVVGQRQAAATATLRAAGFAVSVVRVPVDSRRQDRRVVAQAPAGGYARPGSVVTIMVGQRSGD